MNTYNILAINPGSTSTKIAVFKNEELVFSKSLSHSNEELTAFKSIADQYEYRKDIILNELKTAGIDICEIQAVVGRGGLVKPIESGVYEMNDEMEKDLRNSPIGEHASNLGGLIAKDIARSVKGARAFITDPVVVDEMDELARVSGHPLFQRRSIFHALNQKAVARTYAKSIDENYETLNLIVVHLGGGVSVGAHKKGKVIDVNQALNGEGPFSPERSGTLPVGDLVKMCFSGKYTQKEILKMITGKGGFVAYLGTNSAYDIEIKAQEGDDESMFYYSAMVYQVAKSVGEMYPVLKGDVDAIIITGGIAHSPLFIDLLKERIDKLAPVIVYPGEDEMKALAMNGLMALNGEIQIKKY